MTMPRVVITGVGIMSPLAHHYEGLLEGLRAGRSGIRLMPSWAEPSLGLRTRVGAPVTEFVEHQIDRKLRRNMSRIAMLAMCASEQAIADSRLPPEALHSERTGVSYGSSFGGTSTIEELFASAQRSGVLSQGIGSSTFLKMMPHTCAANIAISFQIPGRILASCVACASGTQAVGYGYESIKLGVVDQVICGGAEELTPSVAAIFDVLGATSIGTPDNTPRPFDATRDGIAVGEGAGSFVLERMDLALARGARIYGEICGFYTNNDASHMTNPSVEGLAQCMRGALKAAHLDASAIDYINAHAAGTIAGDRAESLAIEKVFGSQTPVSSMKGHLGHLMGAAGAIETAACLGMLADQRLYPTLNFQSAGLDEGHIAHVTPGGAAIPLRTLIKNSFAFGGVNASLIIQKM